MKAKIGDVVIDKTYNKKGNLAIVVGEGISQPILIDHKGSITMDKLRDYYSVWDGLEVIGHIDFEKVWKQAVRLADRNSSEKPNNSLDKDTNVRCKEPLEMRDATAEERQGVRNYIKSIAKDTGIKFYEDEPQTVRSNLESFRVDEPQTERSSE